MELLNFLDFFRTKNHNFKQKESYLPVYEDYNGRKKLFERLYLRLKKLEPGELADVVCDPSIKDPRFCVNLNSNYDHNDEFCWGYHGQGPHTLANNILYHFTDDRDFVHKYGIQFLVDVVGKLPEDEFCIISKEKIQKWINSPKKGDEKYVR